jgi:hypothetical protein
LKISIIRGSNPKLFALEGVPIAKRFVDEPTKLAGLEVSSSDTNARESHQEVYAISKLNEKTRHSSQLSLVGDIIDGGARDL